MLNQTIRAVALIPSDQPPPQLGDQVAGASELDGAVCGLTSRRRAQAVHIASICMIPLLVFAVLHA
jgi:hypothetical protein